MVKNVVLTYVVRITAHGVELLKRSFVTAHT